MKVSGDLFFETLSHLCGLQQAFEIQQEENPLAREETGWWWVFFCSSSNSYSNWLKYTVNYHLFLSLPDVAEGNAGKPPEV